jgi:hypothetical protein
VDSARGASTLARRGRRVKGIVGNYLRPSLAARSLSQAAIRMRGRIRQACEARRKLGLERSRGRGLAILASLACARNERLPIFYQEIRSSFS